jgi:hypothetical protein
LKKALKIIGVLTGVFILGVIVLLVVDISNDDKQAATKQEEPAKDEPTEKEKEERAAIMNAFDETSKEVVTQSNGAISDIKITDEGKYFWVRIYVDEATWARSSESEKMSFATTIGKAIEGALSPNSTYVDIMSAANNDTLATQKLFGGWKIKR